MTRTLLLLVGLLTSSLSVARDLPSVAGPDDLLASYIDAVVAGDLDRAASLWRPADRQAAARLGVVYPGAAAPKIDNDSVLWRAADGLRDSSVALQVGRASLVEAGIFAGVYLASVTVTDGKAQGGKDYLMAPDPDGRWSLVRRESWLAEQGTTMPGRYIAVTDRRSDGLVGPPRRLADDLDTAVSVMAAKLELSDRRLECLAEEKLGYLLVDPEVVEVLAGGVTAGVAMLQTDMVVTHHPHHAHELAHLLVNVWLESPPLFTLPLLQEGLAVHLGGRWGRHPRVLERIGRTTLQSGFMSLEELLTRGEFHAQSADLTYAPAGVFAAFVLETAGATGMRRAYLACSGGLDEVNGWTRQDVQRRVAEALNTEWETLATRFADWLLSESGRPGLSAEGPADPAVMKNSPRQTLTTVGLRLDRHDIHDRAHLELLSEIGGPSGAVVLFGGDGDRQARNPLLAEYLPDRPYHGESYLLVFRPRECKLYDLHRQVLLALHSEGFWPSGGATAYLAADGHAMRVSAAPDLVPSFEDAVIIPLEP